MGLPSAAACALLLSSAALAAQTAPVHPFGSSCPRTSSICGGNNTKGGIPTTLRGTPLYLFAVPFTPKTQAVMTGFELYVKGLKNTTFGTYVFRSSVFGGPTGGALRTATLRVGTALGWYRVRFAPLPLAANQRYFVAFIATGQFTLPIVTDATASIWPHYLGRAGGFWRGPFKTQKWAFRVDCAPAGVPALDLKQAAVPGRTFPIALVNATANAPAVLAIGASTARFGPFRLPLDLTPAGAPGCRLYVSLDALALTRSDAGGAAAVSLRIPFSRNLLGARFHLQWLVASPRANRLGLSFSNGATATVVRR